MLQDPLVLFLRGEVLLEVGGLDLLFLLKSWSKRKQEVM